MSVMSFAHLRPNSQQGQPEQSTAKPAEKPAEKPAAIPQQPSPTPLTQSGRPDPDDYLMASGYCYCCPFFSIDAPGNPDHEAAWCCRENSPGSYYQWTFKRIKKGVKVRQCPRRKNNQDKKR